MDPPLPAPPQPAAHTPALNKNTQQSPGSHVYISQTCVWSVGSPMPLSLWFMAAAPTDACAGSAMSKGVETGSDAQSAEEK